MSSGRMYSTEPFPKSVPSDVKPAEKDAVANASHPMVVILRSGDKGVAPTKALDDRVDPP
ncbi:uncharacterized protein N7458_004490 [Penicillium daleae]|uniref:Uncharacterized protein n=1 Tax=Penicillium daleae TaxID=63821 RepID=A0AAD6G3V8_9EURO|nr:uncharacterized protein N7458_004490 [Penicillium daleae]KAJ5453534.1 hypothetical protein N7458_004490 [Penicillium daleae]